MEETKPIWASKTVWFNVLALLTGVALAYGFGDHVADPWVSEGVTVIVTLGNLALRFITSKAIS